MLGAWLSVADDVVKTMRTILGLDVQCTVIAA